MRRILTQALAALNSANPEPSSITHRNPATNDSATARLSAAAVAASTPGGSVAPASLLRSPSRNADTCADAPSSRNWSASVTSKTLAMTAPNTAIASTAAARDTALFTPEATPAISGPTAFMTVVVSGATVTAMPRPNTTTAGRKPLQ